MEDIFQVFGDMMRSGPLNFQESQEPVQINHQQAPGSYSYGSFSFNQQKIPDVFSFGVDGIHQFDQPVMLLDGNKDESMNQFAGNQSPTGQGGQIGFPERSIEKTEQVWQRIRWTDEMVRILIVVVSYVGDEVSSDCPTKGKWRAISNIMVERGYIVSPQQCEDKFNDLNKKFKRLNDLLGKTISCDVVENPALMESMNISEEAKEEVRKILTCKQLFYQEMCSYHNKNRRFLAHDVTLQQSMPSALKGKGKCDDQNVILSILAKRQKHGEDNGVSSWADTHPPEKELTDLINVPPEAIEAQQELSHWMISRSLQLEEKKLQIQNQMFELEKRKFEWLKFCQQEDRELHKMRLENEVMKLENERLAFKLKCRERGYAWD
ncbi:hypothetical protein Salat_0157500 [Sesamum alatum]|uniref:Myb/SANT-like DNA-binding domain-containing protein n=1 Tax=Sesamum alatum TaxID=300844 RepID=A0AAE1YYA5_9LAMI|nr:hypothetical protein Salat_0157500 [Sesamum alatum]